jgi:hypothetical protein
MGTGLPKSKGMALGAEHLAAAAAARRQHPAAIFGGHAGAETMHFAALPLFGLISTNHSGTLLGIKSTGADMRKENHHITCIVYRPRLYLSSMKFLEAIALRRFLVEFNTGSCGNEHKSAYRRRDNLSKKPQSSENQDFIPYAQQTIASVDKANKPIVSAFLRVCLLALSYPE